MEMLEEKQVGKVTQHDRAVERQLDGILRKYFFFAAQLFRWEFRDGFVILSGHVNSFHEKQMAQELTRRVDGVKMVINRLMVRENAKSRVVNETVLSARSSEQLKIHGK